MSEDKAAEIKLIILDVDGVMTDGRIIINDLGQEIKHFNVKDGLGLRLLMKTGIDVVIISGRKSKTVENRGKDLGIKEVYQDIEDKESLYFKLVKQKGLNRNQVCCMGDDLPDIPMFKQAGFSIAVADAVKEVRDAADFITMNKGGNGAVREVCELILKSQGAWPGIISSFTGGEK
jgi:YrbI family 3-deoxy-D-manno-octulosonate 8-phosphate phosphatase